MILFVISSQTATKKFSFYGLCNIVYIAVAVDDIE